MSVKMLSLRNNLTRLSKSGEIAHESNSDHISITLCEINGGSAVAHLRLLGRVVRKPFNVNPGLTANCSIIFSCLKMFFTFNVRCNLRLLQLKSAGQTI